MPNLLVGFLVLGLEAVLSVATSEQVDVVIVGNGPSGLVAAEVLTRDPSISVLLLQSDGADSAFDMAVTSSSWHAITESLRPSKRFFETANWPFDANRVRHGLLTVEKQLELAMMTAPVNHLAVAEAKYSTLAEAFHAAGYRELGAISALKRDNASALVKATSSKTFRRHPMDHQQFRSLCSNWFARLLQHRSNFQTLHNTKVSYLVRARGKSSGVVFDDEHRVWLSARGAVILADGALLNTRVLIQSGIGPEGQLQLLSSFTENDGRSSFPGVNKSLNGDGEWLINKNVGRNLFDVNVIVTDFSWPIRKDLDKANNDHEFDKDHVLLTVSDAFQVDQRNYEFEATIKPSSSNKSALELQLSVVNPESRDYASFLWNGLWKSTTQASLYLATARDLTAMQLWANQVVAVLQRAGAQFCCGLVEELGIDGQWVQQRRNTVGARFGGSCYTSRDAQDAFRCADDTLRVAGSTNVFVADATVMAHPTLNGQGFELYIGYEVGILVKQHLVA